MFTIDTAHENVKAINDNNRPTKRHERAVHEIREKEGHTNEAEFVAICKKHKVNPDKVEILMKGDYDISKQVLEIKRYILTYRSITDSAIYKKFGMYRPDATMKKLADNYGINYRRRKVTVNGREYIRYELIRR